MEGITRKESGADEAGSVVKEQAAACSQPGVRSIMRPWSLGAHGPDGPSSASVGRLRERKPLLGQVVNVPNILNSGRGGHKS
jgi:hypothetical protein